MMKYFIFTIGLLLASPVMANETIQPDHYYEIDSWGSDSDIYEFTPKSDPSLFCIWAVADGKDAADLECFKKPREKK